MAKHGNGLALTFARTETQMFFKYIWNTADAIFFIKRRINFYHLDGTQAKSSGGAPSCLIAYGEACAKELRNCELLGKFIQLKKDGEDYLS